MKELQMTFYYFACHLFARFLRHSDATKTNDQKRARRDIFEKPISAIFKLKRTY